MSEWKARRFWTAVTVAPEAEGYTVKLDGRLVKTPGKSTLILPSEEMAREVAVEWEAQEDVVNPLSMPFTRSANSAIDKVAPQHREVAEMLAAYGDSDLLCYRADAPEALVARQDELWNPALDWAADALGARLEPRTGVIHAPQAAEPLARLAARVHDMTNYQLTGFHDLVSLSGSLILGFAATRGWRDPETLWQLSRLDEVWQEEQWGSDEEAQAMAETKRQAFHHAHRFFELSGKA